MDRSAWRDRLVAAGVSEELAASLALFLELLGRWGEACDLTAELDPESLLRDHVLESLVGAPWLVPGVLLDVGSGAGFPAIPLLLARRDVRGVLLEPRSRRWAFLKEAVRELGLAAEVRRGRLEDGSFSGVENVSVRALAREVWEGKARQLLKPGGRFLWWAGPRACLRPPEGLEDVVTCPLPNPERGWLVVWGRCFT
ncbi:MAG: RsmG family class I SAM-dependent methyltransferase [Acidobacteriota bacterium]|uniref:Ribosomal RNA small subunit methyltransferase G n=1 Tax=Thermoanaerobaculum aquaticum TaxID=1312852 RepID=A0A7C2SRD5_9BACT